MESSTMGRVLTEATIENLEDLRLAQRGILARDQVRRVTVTDALVDTGATMLALPTRLIQQLGLVKKCEKRARSTTGTGQVAVYGPVRPTILDRDLSADVAEVPDELPVLIGQIPLEYFDLVVDPRSQRLIPNPAHGGEHILDML